LLVNNANGKSARARRKISCLQINPAPFAEHLACQIPLFNIIHLRAIQCNGRLQRCIPDGFYEILKKSSVILKLTGFNSILARRKPLLSHAFNPPEKEFLWFFGAEKLNTKNIKLVFAKR
jgi:hypothetical protein